MRKFVFVSDEKILCVVAL